MHIAPEEQLHDSYPPIIILRLDKSVRYRRTYDSRSDKDTQFSKIHVHLTLKVTLKTRKCSCAGNRKRRTARSVTCPGRGGGGGYPIPVGWRGVPQSSQGGTSVPAGGTPGKDLGPKTQKRTWDWGTPPVNGQTPVKTLPSRIP